LLVGTSGTKTWRFRYQRERREYVLTVGHFQPKGKAEHHMSLALARAGAYQLQAELQAGGHPAAKRDQNKNPDSVTFEHAATEYIAYFMNGAGKHRRPAKSTQTYTNLAYRYCKPLYKRPIAEIQPQEFQAIIFGIVKEEKFEAARKTRGFLNKLCRHAYGMGWLPRNPIPDLPTPPAPNTDGFPAITTPARFGDLLRKLDAYDGNVVIRTALRLLPHVFLRPGELRLAKWREVDFKAEVWTIPADRTKLRRNHKVPLSKQAWMILADYQMDMEYPGPGEFIFPSTTHRTRPMSDGTLNFALRHIGIDTKLVHTAHGFRKSASTLLNEAGKNKEIIELCLAHGDPDRVRADYNKAEMLAERKALMQFWSDTIDRLKKAKKKAS
jgi:integrase